MVIAAPHAKFGLPEVNVGLYAMSGGLSRIVRSVGLNFASELALTGRQIGVEEAKQWGLVNGIAKTRSSVVPEALGLANLIASKSPDAIIATRAGIRQGLEHGVEQATNLTNELYRQKVIDGENFKIGVKAFTEKGIPRWVPSRL